jgi:dTDP-4-dehydrorhamnose 3,5-epimerase
MNVSKTVVEGAVIIEPLSFGDERGFFSPVFDDRKFQQIGISEKFCRMNNSCSSYKGTIRGMHYQPPPYQEGKLLRVIRGSIWDVALDLRKDSSSFGKWSGVELTATNRKLFYIPPGCAHGMQMLEDDTEVIYLCSNYYSPSVERGVRWDDPKFGIKWPLEATVISDKDRKHPLFDSEYHLW